METKKRKRRRRETMVIVKTYKVPRKFADVIIPSKSQSIDDSFEATPEYQDRHFVGSVV